MQLITPAHIRDGTSGGIGWLRSWYGHDRNFGTRRASGGFDRVMSCARQPEPAGTAGRQNRWRLRTALPVLFATVALAPASWAQPGQLIASGGGPGGPSSACFRCHGLDGAGQPASGIPLIGGLSAPYLFKQLEDYASGARNDPVMSPIARQLSREERRAVSLYYARLSPKPAQAAATPDPQQLQDGAALYAIGSADLRLQACGNCHGPRAQGLPPTFPGLAGQNATYTAEQLRLWKAGRRRNDPAGVMSHIASRMNEREITAVAAYLAGLRQRERPE
jgi:cytochrome c553